MIDEFVLSHPVVVLDGHRVEIDNSIITTHIYHICCEKNLLPVPLEIFVHTRSAHAQSLQVEVHMARFLPRNFESNFNSMERRLIEAVLLHRLKAIFETNKERPPIAGRAIAVMGTMIQHRLTQISLVLHSGQHDRVFRLGRMPSLFYKPWEIEALGATAVTRVIEAFHVLEGSTIRFPTIHEDVDHGIDLFVEMPAQSQALARMTLQLAISIKSVNQKTRLRSEYIQPESSAAQYKVFEGARVVGQHYGRRFLPVHLLVGRPEGSRPDACPDETDIQELEFLLDRIETSLTTVTSAQSAAA